MGNQIGMVFFNQIDNGGTGRSNDRPPVRMLICIFLMSNPDDAGAYACVFGRLKSEIQEGLLHFGKVFHVKIRGSRMRDRRDKFPAFMLGLQNIFHGTVDAFCLLRTHANAHPANDAELRDNLRLSVFKPNGLDAAIAHAAIAITAIGRIRFDIGDAHGNASLSKTLCFSP